jgi:Holliday junction resolvasome RuvABC endonuclease subunit
MTILALDLGTHTGWATRSGGVVLSGVQNFSGSRYDGGGMRFLRFSRWLDEVGAEATEVVFEEVRRHAGTDAAHIYGGFLALLTKWCEEYGIPYRGIPVPVIKKHATGKGNADKAAMIAAAIARGWAPADDNEADALWILDCAGAGK